MESKQFSNSAPMVSHLQPSINIGFLGHVAHGKSTLIRALSGVATGKFRQEQVKNMTIKLGFANIKIFKCKNSSCPAPESYRAVGTGHADWKIASPKCLRVDCGSEMALQRHVSLVDAPGHHDLMATMLSGACVMDGCVLVVAADDKCPRPQTQEHLIAASMMDISKNTVIVQNKIDLCSRDECLENKRSIQELVNDTPAQSALIIPVAGNLGFNVDVFAQYLCEKIVEPVRDLESPGQMVVIRSFDINKPGNSVFKLSGGIVGGTVTKGVLRQGDVVEIRPGIVRQGADGKIKSVSPILSTIDSLRSEDQEIPEARPGGLIAVGLSIDPSVTKQDRLVGQIVGVPGTLPPVFQDVTIKFQLMRRLVEDESSVPVKFGKLRKDERVQICIGAHRVEASVVSVQESAESKKEGTAKLLLTKPTCARSGSTIALFRRATDQHWRLVGQGTVKKFKELQLVSTDVTTQELSTASKSPRTSPGSLLVDTAPAEICIPADAKDVAKDVGKDAESVDTPVNSMRDPSRISKESKPDSDSTASSGSASDMSLSGPISASSISASSDSTPLEVSRASKKAVQERKAPDDRSVGRQRKKERRAAVLAARDEAAPVDAVQEAKSDDEEQDDDSGDGHRFYVSEVPEEGDLVFVKVTRIDPEIGVFYRLLEYGGLEGLAQASEIAAKRLKSLRQVVHEGMEDVAIVVRCDPIKKTVDLSRKRVKPDEATECRQKYKEAKVVQSILSRTVHSLGSGATLTKLYEQVVWPLSSMDRNALEVFQMALHDQDLAFADCKIHPKTLSALMATLKQRLKLRPVQAKATLCIQHLGPAGAAVIRATTMECSKQAGVLDSKLQPRLQFKFTVETPPNYVLVCTSLNKEEAEDSCGDVIRRVLEDIVKAGGVATCVAEMKLSSGFGVE